MLLLQQVCCSTTYTYTIFSPKTKYTYDMYMQRQSGKHGKMENTIEPFFF